MKNAPSFKRIKAEEFDIDEGIERLKSLRISMILDYIKGYLMVLTVYLLFQIIQIVLLHIYPNKYVMIIGVVLAIVLTYFFNPKPRMLLFLVKDNIEILLQFKKCQETDNVILWHLLKLHSDSFRLMCEMNQFPGIVQEIIIENKSEEEKKEDE